MADITIPCHACTGTGTHLDILGNPGVACATCSGSGGLIVGTCAILDEIVAEQASQRVDLTAALTQIWDKVKDL